MRQILRGFSTQSEVDELHGNEKNHTLCREEHTINTLDSKIPLKLPFLICPCGIEYIGVLNMLTACGKTKILKKSLSVYQEVRKKYKRDGEEKRSSGWTLQLLIQA